MYSPDSTTSALRNVLDIDVYLYDENNKYYTQQKPPPPSVPLKPASDLIEPV